MSRTSSIFVPCVVSLALTMVASVATAQDKPAITAVSVLTAPGQPICPGCLIAITGTALGPSVPVTVAFNDPGGLPTALAGYSVSVNGSPIPIALVSANRVLAVAPFALDGQTPVQVQVSNQTTQSDPFTVNVAPLVPGILTLADSGVGQVLALNADGSANGASAPAPLGSTITIYAAGLGQTNPALSDGQVSSDAFPILASVNVSIGGKTATVQSVTAAPGYVAGYYQIVIIVPAELVYQGSYEVIVDMGGPKSQSGATVAVDGPPPPIPGTPQSLTATQGIGAIVNLAWTAADAIATRFVIDRRPSGTSDFAQLGQVPATSTGFSDTTVTVNAAYDYRVHAETDYGASSYSNVATITPSPPALPSSVTAAAVSPTAILINWTADPASTATVRIERKDTSGNYALLSSVDVSITTFTDAALTPSTSYTYRLRAETPTTQSAFTADITTTTQPPPLPAAPSLQTSVLSASQIRLTWTTQEANPLGFRIERRTATTAFSEVAQQPGTARTWDDSNLQGSTTYSYRIRVQTAAGLSSYSIESVATTQQALPAAPSTLSATPTSPTQVSLTWTNNATDATSIRIESHAAGSSSFVDVGAASSLTSSVVANLQPSTAYTFRVRAQNAAGYSGYSNEATATTQAQAPPAPTLQVTALSSTQAHLSWTSAASNVIRFRVERRTGGGSFAEVAQPAATATTWDDAGLQASTTYGYRMRVETPGGISPYSNEAIATTAQAAPIAPTNLRLTPSSQTQISLSWTNADAHTIAVHIEVRSGTAAYQEALPAFLGSATSGQLSGLSGGSTYVIRLRAETPTGFSAYSNEVSATTLPKTTVFVIHGTAQSSAEIQQLAWSLGDVNSPDHLDLHRFTVNADFDWSECANNPSCGTNCTIQTGAAKLAGLVASAAPQGNLVFVGYSLGGLISREAIASYPALSANGRVAALVTLGTPNMGYPYAPIDDFALNPLRRCSTLVQQMASDYQGSSDPDIPRYQSSYLQGLSQRWAAMPVANRPKNWLVMAGTFCSDTYRSLLDPEGCSNRYPLSDGVVCQASAYFFKGANANLPSDSWFDSTYGHSDITILCTVVPSHSNVLYKPVIGGTLLAKIRGLVNGLQ